MAQILLNLESGINILLNELKENKMDGNIQQFVATLETLKVPISKICDKIRERDDAFGNHTFVVPLTKMDYKHLSKLYHILLNIYEEWKKGLVCPTTIKKVDQFVYNMNIDIPQSLELILFNVSSLK